MLTRRHAIKIGGIGIVGVSGCLEGHLAGANARLSEWLVDPRALSRDHYMTLSIRPDDIAAHSDEFSRAQWEEFKRGISDPMGYSWFDPEDLQRVVLGEAGRIGFLVMEGGFDRERVTDDLRREGFQAGGDHADFQLFVNDDDQAAAGLNDGTIVFGYTSRMAADRVVELIIDASRGEERRYPEVNDDFSVLLEELPDAHVRVSRTREPVEETDIDRGRFRNQVARATAFTIEGEDTRATRGLVFLDERDVVQRDLEEWMQRADSYRSWRDIELSTDGRLATITGTLPTRTVVDDGVLGSPSI